MSEEADHDLWPTPARPQIPLQLIAKLTRRPGTSPARGVGLEVVVPQLHRVRLWAGAGQNVQLDPVGVAPDPGADRLGPVHRMPIHDQVDPPPATIPPAADPGTR